MQSSRIQNEVDTKYGEFYSKQIELMMTDLLSKKPAYLNMDTLAAKLYLKTSKLGSGQKLLRYQAMFEHLKLHMGIILAVLKKLASIPDQSKAIEFRTERPGSQEQINNFNYFIDKKALEDCINEISLKIVYEQTSTFNANLESKINSLKSLFSTVRVKALNVTNHMQLFEDSVQLVGLNIKKYNTVAEQYLAENNFIAKKTIINEFLEVVMLGANHHRKMLASLLPESQNHQAALTIKMAISLGTNVKDRLRAEFTSGPLSFSQDWFEGGNFYSALADYFYASYSVAEINDLQMRVTSTIEKAVKICDFLNSEKLFNNLYEIEVQTLNELLKRSHNTSAPQSGIENNGIVAIKPATKTSGVVTKKVRHVVTKKQASQSKLEQDYQVSLTKTIKLISSLNARKNVLQALVAEINSYNISATEDFTKCMKSYPKMINQISQLTATESCTAENLSQLNATQVEGGELTDETDLLLKTFKAELIYRKTENTKLEAKNKKQAELRDQLEQQRKAAEVKAKAEQEAIQKAAEIKAADEKAMQAAIELEEKNEQAKRAMEHAALQSAKGMCLAQLMTKVQATQDLAQQTIAKSVKDKCMTQLKNKVQVTKELAEQTIAKSNKDKCLSELQGRFLYSIFAPRAQQVTSPVSNDQLAADDKTLWWSDPTTPLFIKKSAAIQQQQDNFLMGRQSKFGV
jgi:hypothetical protein